MLRIIGTLSLSFLILLSGFGNGIYGIVYDFAQVSLTEQYCVNKNDDCCKAKCHMAKVVKEEANSNKTNKRTVFKPAEFLPQTILRIVSPRPFLYTGSSGLYRCGHELAVSHTIWHPPMIIA
jgi:hypothetical protein